MEIGRRTLIGGGTGVLALGVIGMPSASAAALPVAPWPDIKIGELHLNAAVLDLKFVLGCGVYEYDTSNPDLHVPGSLHTQNTWIGTKRAADVNHDGAGDNAEKSWMGSTGQYVAWAHGLSVTCGIYGFVDNHSPGDSMHMHIDVGKYSNTGKGVYTDSRTTHPTQKPYPVRLLQKRLAIGQDGIEGAGTRAALQRRIGVSGDGVWGAGTTSALQGYLNARTGSGLSVDGVLGANTYLAFQRALRDNKF